MNSRPPLGHFAGLTAPGWPENILPPINAARAARGTELYKQRCQGCHLPAPNTAEFWSSAPLCFPLTLQASVTSTST